MKLRDAVHAHIAWLIDLVDAVVEERFVDPDLIRHDDRCPIGRWLLKDVGRYADNPRFRDLREIHKRFHACAAEAAEMAGRGDRGGALHHLDEDGPCGRLSHKLLEAFCDFHGDLRDRGLETEWRLPDGGELEKDLPGRHGNSGHA